MISAIHREWGVPAVRPRSVGGRVRLVYWGHCDDSRPFYSRVREANGFDCLVLRWHRFVLYMTVHS